MKKLLTYLAVLLLATTVYAGEKWVMLWLDSRATPPDVENVENKINALLPDPRPLVLTNLTSIYELIANTNIRGTVISFDKDYLKHLGISTNNITKAKFDTWRNNPAKLSNPNFLKYRTGDNPITIISNAGLRRVEGGGPQ